MKNTVKTAQNAFVQLIGGILIAFITLVLGGSIFYSFADGFGSQAPKEVQDAEERYQKTVEIRQEASELADMAVQNLYSAQWSECMAEKALAVDKLVANWYDGEEHRADLEMKSMYNCDTRAYQGFK